MYSNHKDPIDLLKNIERIHTTELGLLRIKRNLSLSDIDVMAWCKCIITQNNSKIIRHGKNWYVENGQVVLTVNAYSFTIITAHKK